MSTVEVVRTVDAPVERIWAVFTDLAGRPAVLSSVHDVEVLTEGEFGVGSAWREARQTADGTRVLEELRVVECDPPRRCVVALAGDGVDYRLTYTFVSRGRDRTTVTATVEGTPRDMRGRVLAAFLGGLAARVVAGALRTDLDDLAGGAA